MSPSSRRPDTGSGSVLAFQIAIGVGIVIATVVGASESIVWRWSIGIAAVPAAIMLALLLRLPESPRWLVRGGDRDGAAAVLRRVRPSGFDVDGELDEMADLARKEQKASTRGWYHADPAQPDQRRRGGPRDVAVRRVERFAAWLFVYFRMPDLTGASLEEIERKLADGRFKPAEFTRTEAAPSPR